MRRANGVVMALVMVVAACVHPGADVSPYGKPATLHTRSQGSVTGELLAARSDSIWLRRNGTAVAFSTMDVATLNVERHSFDGRKTLWSMATLGAATGAAMVVACSNYRPGNSSRTGSCGGWFFGTTGVFAALGGVFAISNNYSSMYHLVPADTLRLKAYSRYPQGMPPTK